MAKKNSGDILGLSDASSSSSGPGVNDEIVNRTSDSFAETEKRRRRMSEGADEVTPSGTGPEHQGGHGATGIDMGAGGEGTDIE